jgi:PEP-CTERM motif-containing protein
MKKVWLIAVLAMAAGLGTVQAQNFLTNPGFETADGNASDNFVAANWFAFPQTDTIVRDITQADTGIASLRFDHIVTDRGGFQGAVNMNSPGFVGPAGFAEFMPLGGITHLEFSGRVKETASAYLGLGKLQIEWATAANNASVVRRDYESFTGAQINNSSWTLFSAKFDAPVGATHAKFVLVDDTITTPVDGGGFYVDSLVAIPEPSSIAMLALGGVALVGLTMRRRK